MNPIKVCHQIISIKSHTLYLGSRGAFTEKIINLYNIGSFVSAVQPDFFVKFNLHHKLKQMNFSEEDAFFADVNNIEGTPHIIQKVADFIFNKLQKNNILVYCETGVSASAFLVACFLVRFQKMTALEARHFITKKRYVSVIQEHFQVLLNKYQQLFQKEATIINNPSSVYDSLLKQTKICSHIIAVTNPSNSDYGNLFLGESSSIRQKWLQKFKIKAVLSILTKEAYTIIKIQQTCKKMGIINKFIEMKDSESAQLTDHFEASIQFINKYIENGNTIVHCKAGRSRSASIVIAYIMKKFKVSYNEALKFVCSKRDCVRPNKGFQIQLIQFSSKQRTL